MPSNATAAQYLAINSQALRRKKMLSQQQLAELAGIPRSTVTNIESGAANPSLSNLAKLSAALGVGLEELVTRPRSECSLIPADAVPVITHSDGLVCIHKLLPERVNGMEIDRIELVAGASLAGTAHVRGTKEYLHCLAGMFTVLVAGEAFAVARGAVLAFPGDQPHSYRNRGKTGASAISIVVPVPVQAVARRTPVVSGSRGAAR